MARIDAILGFVEAQEYRREFARRLAASLLLGQDVEGVDVADVISRLIEQLDTQGILAAALTDSLDHLETIGLGSVRARVEAALPEIVDAAVTRVSDEAGLMLSARLSEAARALDRMPAGMVTPSVNEALMSGFGSVLKSTGAGLVSAIEGDIVGRGVDEVDDPGAEFAWETRQDDRTCFDQFENSCEPRHGWVLSLDEWDSVGRPQSDNLLCTIYAKGDFSNCRCVLLAADVADRMPTPVRVGDAAARGRARAVEEAA